MKIVFLNISRINYDGKIDLSKYSDVTFYDSTNYDEIISRVNGYDVVVVKEMKLDRDLIYRFNGVKLICEARTGYNNIDIDACRDMNINVCNAPGYATGNVALFTIMLMLNMSVSMKSQQDMLHNGDYSNFSNILKVNYSKLTGKVLGIIGTGTIGSEVERFATTLGMNVIGYSHTKKEDTEYIHFVTLNELLTNSDYISLHSLLNNDNYHMLNETNMNLIKNTTYIINTARGALIDEEYLIKCLREHKIAGAGLDVSEHEPLTSEDELFRLDNVIVTPHMAWNSLEARCRLMDIVFSNINNYSNGKEYNSVY